MHVMAYEYFISVHGFILSKLVLLFQLIFVDISDVAW